MDINELSDLQNDVLTLYTQVATEAKGIKPDKSETGSSIKDSIINDIKKLDSLECKIIDANNILEEYAIELDATTDNNKHTDHRTKLEKKVADCKEFISKYIPSITKKRTDEMQSNKYIKKSDIGSIIPAINEKLKNKNNELISDIEEIKKENTKLKEENHKYKAKICLCDNDNIATSNGAINSALSMLDQMANTQASLSEIQINALKNRINTLSEANKALHQQNISKDSLLITATNEIVALRSNKEMKNVEAQLKEAQQQIERQKQENKQLKENNNTLTEDNAKKLSIIAKNNNTIEEQGKEIAILKETTKSYNQAKLDIQKLNCTINTQANTISTYDNNTSKIKQDYESSLRREKHCQEQVEILKVHAANDTEQKEKIAANFNSLSITYEQVKADRSKILEQYEKCKHDKVETLNSNASIITERAAEYDKIMNAVEARIRVATQDRAKRYQEQNACTLAIESKIKQLSNMQAELKEIRALTDSKIQEYNTIISSQPIKMQEVQQIQQPLLWIVWLLAFLVLIAAFSLCIVI